MTTRVQTLGDREGLGLVTAPSSSVVPSSFTEEAENDILDLQEEVEVLLETSLGTDLVVGAQVVPTTVPQAWTAIGAAQVDFSLYTTAAWVSSIFTANPSNAAEIRLYNRTDASVLASASSTSTETETVTAPLAPLSGLKTVEVQIRSALESPVTSATCLRSRLAFTFIPETP